MAKQVSDLIVERLIEWGVDTIFGFPGDGVDGFFESLRTHQENSASSRCVMKRPRLLLPAAMRSTPAALAFAAQPRGPAAFIFSTGFTTPSAICSRCSPSPGIPFTTSSEWTTSRMSISTSSTWTSLSSTSASWGRPTRSTSSTWRSAPLMAAAASLTSAFPKDIQEWPVSDKMRSNANIAGP